MSILDTPKWLERSGTSHHAGSPLELQHAFYWILAMRPESSLLADIFRVAVL